MELIMKYRIMLITTSSAHDNILRFYVFSNQPTVQLAFPFVCEAAR